MIAEFLGSWALFGDAWLAGWLIGVLLALLGVLIVARDQIFIGAAVSQASVLGIATMLWLADTALLAACTWCHDDWVLALGGGGFAVLGALATAGSDRVGGESPEAVTGWVFLASGSVAVLLLAHSPHGMDEINRLLASTIIGATRADVVLFAALLAAAALVLARWHEALILLVLDPETAGAVGVPVRRVDRALTIVLGVLAGLAIRVSGVVFTFGVLVLPALIAKSVCREVRTMFWAAPAIALAGGVAGFVLAHHLDLPPAQTAVALLGAALVGAWVVRRARRRGASPLTRRERGATAEP